LTANGLPAPGGANTAIEIGLGLRTFVVNVLAKQISDAAETFDLIALDGDLSAVLKDRHKQVKAFRIFMPPLVRIDE